MKLKLHLAVIALIAFSFTSNAQVSENEGAARQWITSHARDLKLKSSDTFKLSFVFKSTAGETLRFQQMMNEVPVYQSEIVVNFNPDKEIAFTTDSYDRTIEDISTIPSLSEQGALDASKNHLKFTTEYTVAENKLIVTKVNDQTKLVYRVVTNPASGNGSWEVLVDAQNGSILSTKDVALYHNKKANTNLFKKTNPPTGAMAPLAFVSGTAMVFLTDPLSKNRVLYGVSGYTDASDADSANLTASRTAVTLPEIDLTAGVYKLKSSYVEITDFEAPTTGLFTQATSAFNFTRSQNGFEATNVFYHLDTSLRYINETLGITCRPSLNGGVLRFDPSGLNGVDNSHYLPASDQISFGEGCVDDAEDADVIWHELGHGIHDWITNGSAASQIGEGNGDYWAVSYSRSFTNQWTAADDQYQWVFSWDGHNTCWDGRRVDTPKMYPTDLDGEVHDDGEIWAAALMQIYEEIGRTKMDKAFLNGVAMTNSSSNQQTAARAVRQAAINMNYPCTDIQVFTQKFTDRGYVMPALPLTMAAIANQTVTAEPSNTYTLPSYAVLANPITDACNATLTQDPVVGTVLAPGVYTITMQATSGTTVTRTFQLTVNPFLGIEDVIKNNFVLYPNPAANVLNVKGDFDANEKITIYNMLGQTVMTKAVTSNEQSIDVSSLAKGIYNVYFNVAKATYKFVKE
jgi:Zn-dependent metalloprotease